MRLLRFLLRPPVPLHIAAAVALGKAAAHAPSALCSPEEDNAEFMKIILASGLNPNWYVDLARVGVGSVIDACSAFDGTLSVEPPQTQEQHYSIAGWRSPS